MLATLAVKDIDEKTAPWPYGSTLPGTPRERLGNISFIPPAPGSGLTVYFGIADSAEGGILFLQIKNGRSTLGINLETGAVSMTKVAIEDQEAFNRFSSEIQYAGPGE